LKKTSQNSSPTIETDYWSNIIHTGTNNHVRMIAMDKKMRKLPNHPVILQQPNFVDGNPMAIDS